MTETLYTGPTIDAPEGYEYRPASEQVHVTLSKRFDLHAPVGIHPDRPNVVLWNIGNFWDGPSEVVINDDGSYTYTSPYTGETDRFNDDGYWTQSGAFKLWSQN